MSTGGTITPRLLAERCGKSKRCIERAAGRLKLPKVHGRYLFTASQAEAVLAETHDGPGQPSKKIRAAKQLFRKSQVTTA